MRGGWLKMLYLRCYSLLAPRGGLEPPTIRLTAERSAN